MAPPRLVVAHDGDRGLPAGVAALSDSYRPQIDSTMLVRLGEETS